MPFDKVEYIEGHPQPENPYKTTERRKRIAALRAAMKRRGSQSLPKRKNG